METVAIICMLTGALLYSISIVTQRYLQKTVLTVRGALIFNYGLGFLVMLSGIWWWTPFMESVGLATPIRDDPTIFWIGAIWATGWNILISYANAKSREHADVSLTQPFQGVTPGLITITALLFHEWPSAIGIVGIIFIAVFTYIHGREGATKLSDWLLPFRALVVLQLPKNFDSLPENERSEVLLKTARQRSGVRWAFVSALKRRPKKW